MDMTYSNGGEMKNLALIVLAVLLLQGCSGIKTQIQFVKQDSNSTPTNKISGTLVGRFSGVQDFRSLLESLEYRVTEKAK